MGPGELPPLRLATRRTVRSARAALAAAAMIAITASLASAHVELVSSMPTAGTNLQIAPTEVTITFDDELDPDLSHFTVADASSATVGSGGVDLTVADRNVMRGPVTVTNPGVYTVTYSIAGVDGHVVEGSFSFGYRATSAIPEPTGGEGPDTAMPPAGDAWTPIIFGALLVVLTVAVAARRNAVHAELKR